MFVLELTQEYWLSEFNNGFYIKWTFWTSPKISLSAHSYSDTLQVVWPILTTRTWYTGIYNGTQLWPTRYSASYIRINTGNHSISNSTCSFTFVGIGYND